MRPPPPPEEARINLGDLRSRIMKQVGLERSGRYFIYLNNFLSRKLSKPEFNKLCILTLGHDNLPLHNQLIRSILKNAVQAKVPPPPLIEQKLSVPPHPGWSNGDFSTPSPRDSRSSIQRIKDQASLLRPNGRDDAPPRQSLKDEEGFIIENGSFARHQQNGYIEQPAKGPPIEKLSSQHTLTPVYSKDLVEVVMAEDRKDVQLLCSLNSARGPLRAPLGIPFCPASVGGAQRPLPLPTSSGFSSNYVGGELCHTEDLRRRMEVMVHAQGLGEVTMDCANLLNNSLDAYLKRLIRSCFELVGGRSGHGLMKQQMVCKKQPHVKPINGVLLGKHMQSMPESGNHFGVSMRDFKVAMELNRQQLGEDWPSLLEKICLSSFED